MMYPYKKMIGALHVYNTNCIIEMKSPAYRRIGPEERKKERKGAVGMVWYDMLCRAMYHSGWP